MINNIIKTLEKINYGYKDNNNKIHNNVDEFFSDTYTLQNPKRNTKKHKRKIHKI